MNVLEQERVDRLVVQPLSIPQASKRCLSNVLPSNFQRWRLLHSLAPVHVSWSHPVYGATVQRGCYILLVVARQNDVLREQPEIGFVCFN